MGPRAWRCCLPRLRRAPCRPTCHARPVLPTLPAQFPRRSLRSQSLFCPRWPRPPAPRCCRACPGCRARSAWPPGCRPVVPCHARGAAVLAGCTVARRCCRQRPARLQSRCACWWWAPCMATSSPPHRWPCAGLAWRRPRGGGRGRASARALALHPRAEPRRPAGPQTHARECGRVDLNRNFPRRLGRGSPGVLGKAHPQGPRRWPGHTPLSEPGIALLHQQMDQFQPQLVVSIHAPYGCWTLTAPTTRRCGWAACAWTSWACSPARWGITAGCTGRAGGHHRAGARPAHAARCRSARHVA